MQANGWTIVDLPVPWFFTQMDWTIRVPTTSNISPFSGQTKSVIQWPGADGWMVTVTLPPLSMDQARDWTSFLWDAQGGATAFLLGDPLRRTPRGTVNSTITVNGAQSASSNTVALKGFHPNQPRVLMRGDLISINYRLYQVRDKYVSADATGAATVTIGPSLREALTDGMSCATHDATGMMRLAKSDNMFSSSQGVISSMSFPCIEAR